ncbi:MAG TPA: PQQ-dependent sugar dehydrogenase [Microthrixaceae bacterium]|nr:PQQ-dependent sugar dehydrogenase [Microthrixaceae bacterium]
MARGLRNPWRISVDLPTGDLWIGDVGEGSYEEVNVVRADQFDDVANFGWPYREGPDSRPRVPASPPVRLTDPVYARSRQDRLASAVIGGAVYRGRRFPWLVGKYLFSDLSDPTVRAFYPGGTEVVFDAPAVTQLNEDRVISFGQLRDGEVAVLTGGGHVYELVADNSAPEGVTTRYLFDVWPAPQMNVISEGTAVTPDPKGPGFLSAELRGRIHRIIPRTVARRWCGYDLSDVPQWNNDDPADLERQVGELRRLLDERRDDFPAWIRASVNTARRGAQRMVGLASSDGWGSEPVERFLEEAWIERGEFADLQRAVATLSAYRSTFCT